MIVDRILTVKIPELSDREWGKLEKKLTYVNGNGELVQSYKRLITRGEYVIPRGAWSIMPDKIRFHDQRICPPMPDLNFIVDLDDIEKDPRYEGQKAAVRAMLTQEQGLIIRAPGTGKTQIALAFAAECQTRTLVVVHTDDILKQWVEYVENAIPQLQGEVGIVQGRTKKIGHITIATVQTLQKYLRDKNFWKQFGALIIDEAHHSAAVSWEAVINSCPAKFRFGFTASPTRADGMHPSMRFLIGPVIHRQKFSSPVKLSVVPVKTEFRGRYRGSFDWTRLVNELVRDDARNTQIARIADREIEKGNTVLVLSRRIEHLEKIAELMRNDVEILAAQLRTKKERHEAIQNFRSGDVSCILATQLADEALDVPRLNRVLLVHPGKHEGRIIQQIGRAIRQHPTKTDAVIYDFTDTRVGVLRNQWRKRKRTYDKEGISIKKVGKLKWKNN